MKVSESIGQLGMRMCAHTHALNVLRAEDQAESRFADFWLQ